MIYTLLYKTLLRKSSVCFSECVLLLVPAYIALSKMSGYSVSELLTDYIFHPDVVKSLTSVVIFIISYSVVVKVLLHLVDKLIPAPIETADPREISECITVMNKELSKHCNKLEQDQELLRELQKDHSFDLNIQIIVNSLAEHIKQCSPGIKIKNKDIFISVYTLHGSILEYEYHYDFKRDLVQSKHIDLTDRKFQNYECTKCINSPNYTKCILDKRKYARGHSKRHKTIEHYIGYQLGTEEHTFGFLNLEFHNHRIFGCEEQMQDFVEEVVFPYKTLLEYQYLKRNFFNAVTPQ